ncbi:MAG: DUF445 family protein [Desulfobulbaceae bacterium]|uniref:DUF445 family protein n=1 Tax=Candidatus Desulfatifera sulfidica TaxID=2841691 RepID=A0A8J6TCS4_9BACT|nr:DUF445 family protein [Candidatus Desulfatifera sulfidica]
MSPLPPEILTGAVYAAPPLVGAFIGYLTNRVAIRMLFRPLKPWRILGVRIPMTPGVIPSKRHELAQNIGNMVGTHLLTSNEIGAALHREEFQSHLRLMIKTRGDDLLSRDLGPMETVIPQRFHSYLDVAVQALIYRIQEGLYEFISSDRFANLVGQGVDGQFQRILSRDLGDFLSEEERSEIYAFLEQSLARLTESPAMEQWVSSFVKGKIMQALDEEKSLANILPDSLQELIGVTIVGQTPVLLDRLAQLLREPETRNRIVKGVRAGVEHFIASMGPMAGMVGSFLSMEVVETKVREYLDEKDGEISAWLQNEEAQLRVAQILRERSEAFLNRPLNSFVTGQNDERVSQVSELLSEQLLTLMRGAEVRSAVAVLLRDNIETHIQGGKRPLGDVLADFIGENGVRSGREWIREEILTLLRSRRSRRMIQVMVRSLVSAFAARPLGRLAHLVPAGVRDGLYDGLQKMATDVLANEVPGLVDSFNIRKIVCEKVDSLDLMRLERLLLSIMEEQFKYINLFGALLGFTIGCLNLFFIF